MNEQEQGNTNIVLPIICTHCGKEVNLAVDFTLLAPEEKTKDIIEPEEA
jgi:hypothetical protein